MAGELSIANTATTLGKAEFRDKFGRVFQFMALCLTGFADLFKPEKGTPMHTLGRTACHVFFHISLTRRSHRFFKGFIFHNKMRGNLKAIADPVDKLFEYAQAGFLQIFFCIDMYAWMKQIKLLPDPATRKARGMQTVYYGVRFFFFSSIVSTLYNAKKLMEISKEQPQDQDAQAIAQWKAKRRRTAIDMMKFAMRVFETAHISKLWVTHDFPVGISGMISSSIDSYGQWPTA